MNNNYKAKCKKDHSTWYLSVTHNGNQWTSISIKNPDHEVPLILEALSNLTSRSSKSGTCVCHPMGNNIIKVNPLCSEHGVKPPPV